MGLELSLGELEAALIASSWMESLHSKAYVAGVVETTRGNKMVGVEHGVVLIRTSSGMDYPQGPAHTSGNCPS